MIKIPAFFDLSESKAGQIWGVDYNARQADATEFARSNGIKPSSEDVKKVCLLLIDPQNTFCIPQLGELPVYGAVSDCIRTSRFIYENLDKITTVVVSMDTHYPIQIFTPLFWVNAEGNHPNPNTEISADDVKAGKWIPDRRLATSDDEYRTLCEYAFHYCSELEKGGRYRLMIWNYHAQILGIGYAVVPILHEAIFFHSVARSAQPAIVAKGDNFMTENYSILEPEVKTNQKGEQIALVNDPLFSEIIKFDAIIVAGQAKSHCVAWTLESFLKRISVADQALVKKFYLLEDCTSPVVIPGIVDYSAEADASFARFADVGMHRVKSTDPIESWTDSPFAIQK